MIENKPGRPKRTGLDPALFRFRVAYIQEQFHPPGAERLHAWDRKMRGADARPKTPGRPPRPGQTRMFVAAVQHYRAWWDVRHVGRSHKGPWQCCPEGGSALDVCGAAFGFTYATAASQWGKRARE